MNKDELEQKMREVLAKFGKPQTEIDKIVPFLLNQSFLQTDENRQIFFNQWADQYYSQNITIKSITMCPANPSGKHIRQTGQYVHCALCGARLL